MNYYQISSGRGPEECEIAVARFMGYLIHEKLVKNEDIIEEVQGFNEYSFKSIFFKTDKDLSKFIGTIQWICDSPIRRTCRRKNWFFSLRMFQNTAEFEEFDENQVVFKTMRSGGPGGQNVNKVETAVRAIYKDINVVARTERSQLTNKKIAVEKIKLQLLRKQDQNSVAENKSHWNQHNQLERGNPVAVFSGLRFKKKEN